MEFARSVSWVLGKWVSSCHIRANEEYSHELSGLGIAYVSALRAKVPVQLYDRSPEQVKKGLALMDKLLAKDVTKVRAPAIPIVHFRTVFSRGKLAVRKQKRPVIVSA